MIRIAYAIISRLSLPVFYFYLVYRGIREPAYLLRKRERFGFVPSAFNTGSIWFHTVSAGEAIAAIPIIEHVMGENATERVLITTTTPTGYQALSNHFGAKVDLCFVPYDVPSCVKRFLKRTRPKLLFLMETELWPNLIRLTASSGTPIYLLNARLSDKSFKGYARVRGLTHTMLKNVRGIACQYEDSAQRFLSLGVPESQLFVTGNVKFDISLPHKSVTENFHVFEELLNDGALIWIAGSTHSPEERILLEAHVTVLNEHSDAILILVPRHVARCEEVLSECKTIGLKACTLNEFDLNTRVFIVDQMGVLFTLYQFAEIAYVGGSLQHTGGHNPIEPAFHGVPILMGPHRHNFAEVCARFEEQDCLFTVRNADEIAEKVLYFHNDQTAREQCSKRARTVVQANQGALNQVCGLLNRWMEEVDRAND